VRERGCAAAVLAKGRASRSYASRAFKSQPAGRSQLDKRRTLRRATGGDGHALVSDFNDGTLWVVPLPRPARLARSEVI
jgi:hypothetical protein